MDFQAPFSQQALEFAVLQLAQPFGLAGVHPPGLRAPLLKAGVTEAMLTSACLGDPLICSSLYLLVLMPIIPWVDGLLGNMTGTYVARSLPLPKNYSFRCRPHRGRPIVALQVRNFTSFKNICT